MNQKSLIIIVVIVLVLVGGYLGRHQIKSMLGMKTSTPASQDITPTPTTAANPSTTETSITTTATNPQKGDYFADTKGMALYTYDKDTADKSTCTGGCLTAWPPYKASSADTAGLPSNFGIITTADGTFQYTYKQMPLYYYQKDTKPGDVTGDGVGGVWHLITHN